MPTSPRTRSPNRSNGDPSVAQRNYVERLSALFGQIGAWSFDHRWVVLAICLLLLGASVFLAAGVRFDNSFEAYFDTDDPAYAAYNGFREDFGSDEISYILYEAPGLPHGPFDLGVMRKIASLTTAAGFVSMSIAPIKSISHFAVYSAVGVVADFLLMPALVLTWKPWGPGR